jgi:tetratricopeptide (TPR) repeat protein
VNPSRLSGGGALNDVCLLRASLPGFQSDPYYFTGKYDVIETLDTGTFVLKPLLDVKGFSFSTTTATAPAQARKAYDRGVQLLESGKAGAAQSEFQKAVDAYPQFAAAFYELGLIAHDSDRVAARQWYLRAIQADPKYIRPYAELARLSAAERDWAAALDWSTKCVGLNRYGSPDAFFYGAVAKFNLGDGAGAEEFARRAAELDFRHRNPKIQQLLAAILLRKQDAAGAAEQLKAYLQYAPDAKDAPAVRQKLAAIEGK